jgi:hypothetical protein
MVPSGWCWTSGAGPAPPPAPAMTSLVRTSTRISLIPTWSFAAQHGLEAAMWRRTAARLRNRPQLESWPVSVHLARVARHPSPGAAGPAAGTLTRLAMIATAISRGWRRATTLHMSQTWNNTVCTRCGPDPMVYTRTAGPGCAKKKIKTFLQQKRVWQWVDRRRMQDAEEGWNCGWNQRQNCLIACPSQK